VILDRAAALRRMGGDERLFGEIAQFFIEDSPGLLRDAEAGIRANDPVRVALAAHTLKGLASNFDSDTVVEAALQLETLGRSGRLDGARDLLEQLQARVTLLNEQLSDYGLRAED